MNSQMTQTATTDAADEQAIRGVHSQLIDGWNRGSGRAFAAPFSETADFVAFDGTHLQGRRQIITFHQQIFDTVMKGSRLEGAVKFVRFLNPQVAVMHGVVRVLLAGQTEPSPSRDSMQLFVVARSDGAWRVEAVLNARILTLERQYFLDNLDSLCSEAQRQFSDVIENQALEGKK